MAIEIERKFLVKKDLWQALQKPSGKRFQQGYIHTDPENSVRVRLTPEKAFLTVKGASNGATRSEFEYEIPATDAEDLFNTMVSCSLEKIRYEIDVNDRRWEVDEFLDQNEGLIVAEVELKKADEMISLPDWVSKEITDDPKYYNLNLAQFPYELWRPKEKPDYELPAPMEALEEIRGELQCGMVCYLHKNTFEIVAMPDVDRFPDFEFDDPEWQQEIGRVKSNADFIYIESPDSRHSFKIMEDFAFLLPVGPLKTRLMDALEGRKPFANFNRIIHQAGAERDQWFLYRDERWTDHIIQWLELNMKDEDEA